VPRLSSMVVLLTNQPQSPKSGKKRESDRDKGVGVRGVVRDVCSSKALRILPPKVFDRVEGNELLERLLPVVGV